MPARPYSREPVTLSFPPFTRAIAWLIGINAGLYLLLRLLSLSPASAGLYQSIAIAGTLTPSLVVHHGWLWQLATYDFINLDLLALVINMLMLWMFGAQIEQSWGPRRFLGLYFSSLVGAGLITVGLAYAHMPGLAPDFTVMGAAAGVYGVLIAFSVLFAESEFMMFPLPFMIKAKYFAWILIFITLALSLRQVNAWMAVPQLAGILCGYLFVKVVRRLPARVYVGYRGTPVAAPKPSLAARWRDSYYRWKRRRAARKFEVYMRKHDRQVFFDEHGNYIGPEPGQPGDRRAGDDKSSWIN